MFLHGWSLGPHAYEDVLHELMARGCEVYAPALPGFGGTANLPGDQRTIEGYAAWVEAFLEAVEADGPALVVGHSFGGGVGIRLAHDAPERVGNLVLINSVGTPSGSSAVRRWPPSPTTVPSGSSASTSPGSCSGRAAATASWRPSAPTWCATW